MTDFISPLSIINSRDTRQRRKIEVEDLKSSITLYGIIQPIIISQDLKLIAGERRLTAAIELGLSEVPVRYLSELSKIELEIIELEENVKRSDLDWKDQVNATARIHLLFQQQDENWKAENTAQHLGITPASISILLSVYRNMEDPVIAAATGWRPAYNVILRREARRSGDAIAEFFELPPPPLPTPESTSETEGTSEGGFDFAENALAPTPPSAPWKAPTPLLPLARIEHTSFLEWAPLYSGPKFNFIHCDFPYGINAFSGKQAGAERHGDYDDSPDIYWALLEALAANWDRFASFSSHLMFWYSDKHRQKTLEFFAERLPQLEFYPYPLVWHKTDNVGIAGDSQRHPRHVYETALMAYSARRPLVKMTGDCYGAPTAKLLHSSTKPEPMLKHFFQMFVDGESRVLDPTCGSGAAIRAADALGAAHALGLEIDAEYADRATAALSQAQRIRHSAGALS